jgi:5-methylcytosine-specific restriction endonuclease McrA
MDRGLSKSEQVQLEALYSACNDLGLSLEEALQQKTQEVRLRNFLRCIPNGRVKEADIDDFLRRVLGGEPPRDLRSRITFSARGLRISESEVVDLEECQCGRCALCGVILDKGVEPQIDHVVPVALGGKSEMANYQILCRRCNVGKGKLLSWLMAAPYFLDRTDELSAQLRFCVLASHQGHCSVLDCESGAKDCPLEVVPIVDVAHGGRWIFDNLTAMCREHADERRQALKSGLMRQLYMAKFWRRSSLRRN